MASLRAPVAYLAVTICSPTLAIRDGITLDEHLVKAHVQEPPRAHEPAISGVSAVQVAAVGLFQANSSEGWVPATGCTTQCGSTLYDGLKLDEKHCGMCQNKTKHSCPLFWQQVRDSRDSGRKMCCKKRECLPRGRKHAMAMATRSQSEDEDDVFVDDTQGLLTDHGGSVPVGYGRAKRTAVQRPTVEINKAFSGSSSAIKPDSHEQEGDGATATLVDLRTPGQIEKEAKDQAFDQKADEYADKVRGAHRHNEKLRAQKERLHKHLKHHQVHTSSPFGAWGMGI